MRVRVEMSDASYADLDGRAIDRQMVDFRRVNRLSGPIWIEGAAPGDAVGFAVESIDVGSRAFAVYVARWRSRLFGLSESRVIEVAVRDSRIELTDGTGFAIRPMIGCIGVAPAREAVSSLAPTARSGGNMDLPEVASGATVWLPVEVEGALLSMGDLHARMGRGEPLGSGLECGGCVVGRVLLAKGRAIVGPVVRTADRVAFIGTSDLDWRDAEAAAVRMAWAWLTTECRLDERRALVAAGALVDIDTGGPAGNNVVASIPISELLEFGVDRRVWPLRNESGDAG
jgi:amidase